MESPVKSTTLSAYQEWTKMLTNMESAIKEMTKEERANLEVRHQKNKSLLEALKDLGYKMTAAVFEEVELTNSLQALRDQRQSIGHCINQAKENADKLRKDVASKKTLLDKLLHKKSKTQARLDKVTEDLRETRLELEQRTRELQVKQAETLSCRSELESVCAAMTKLKADRRAVELEAKRQENLVEEATAHLEETKRRLACAQERLDETLKAQKDATAQVKWAWTCLPQSNEVIPLTCEPPTFVGGKLKKPKALPPLNSPLNSPLNPPLKGKWRRPPGKTNKIVPLLSDEVGDTLTSTGLSSASLPSLPGSTLIEI